MLSESLSEDEFPLRSSLHCPRHNRETLGLGLFTPNYGAPQLLYEGFPNIVVENAAILRRKLSLQLCNPKYSLHTVGEFGKLGLI